jgi:hypothetical protein
MTKIRRPPFEFTYDPESCEILDPASCISENLRARYGGTETSGRPRRGSAASFM